MQSFVRLRPLYRTGGAIIALSVALTPAASQAQSAAADRIEASSGRCARCKAN